MNTNKVIVILSGFIFFGYLFMPWMPDIGAGQGSGIIRILFSLQVVICYQTVIVSHLDILAFTLPLYYFRYKGGTKYHKINGILLTMQIVLLLYITLIKYFYFVDFSRHNSRGWGNPRALHLNVTSYFDYLYKIPRAWLTPGRRTGRSTLSFYEPAINIKLFITLALYIVFFSLRFRQKKPEATAETPFPETNGN